MSQQLLSDQDLQAIDFLNSLVSAITGFSLSDYTEELRYDISKKCLKIFFDYVNNFVEEKYGKTQALRLKAIESYSDLNLFNKFPETYNHFTEAFKSFVEVLAAQPL